MDEPTHQGRAAEKVLFTAVCRKHPFRMITVTNNTGGGQPVAMANIRAYAQQLRQHGKPFLMDVCRFAENAMFIKLREPGYENTPTRDIVQEMFSYAADCTMSAKRTAWSTWAASSRCATTPGSTAYATASRRSDIPLLANHFLARHVTRLGKPVQGLTPRAVAALMRHNWPGNVRGLENAIQSMIILTESDWLDVDALPPRLASEGESPVRIFDGIEPQSLEEIEAYFIAKTLLETKGNRTTAAEILGIDKSTLWRKVKRYELE